jgi:hypothetical protein
MSSLMLGLIFSVWPLEHQVSAVIRALFNLNAHHGTVFPLSDERDVHLMGQHCPIRLLQSNTVDAL